MHPSKPLLRAGLILLAGFALPWTAAGQNAASSDLEWPEITWQTKPWSRWWWLGNIGTKQDFTTEMEKYAQAGLGGLEITPIYGVRGEEKRFRDFLSPEFLELFEHVLDEGERLGLRLDMSTGTGWPFGGPWVTPDMAARHVVTKTYTLKSGERLAEPVGATEEAFDPVRVAGPRRVSLGELTDPITSNANLQDLAIDQVRFPRQLPLQALVAYSDTGDKLDVTGKVGADGRLDWAAPDGSWTLYAVFPGWHGKLVERAGPGGEGDVIDHFSAEALARYLKKFDEAYAGRRTNRLRAYFNDSYEVDDARGESNWTVRFFDEFKRRRGYDLRDELPAFFGRDTEEKNARVMSDHRETISDLLLEEFTIPWAKWARTHNAIVRNQAHGSPANIIDLYAASDIPETEGSNIIGMKFASSAAHLAGRQLTSSETATWLDEHWVSTLGDIKRRVDLMFLGGVNHHCYHGTVFSPPNEPWPGFHFYASVELATANPIWADFSALNAYVARVQSFLQSGKPGNDILLYYPIHDQWAVRGDGAMPHFLGGARPGGYGIAQTLSERGYTFDFVSDRLLAKVTSADGALEAAGSRYRAIVVPEAKFMPLETWEHLYRLAEAGATVIFHRSLPQDVPGLGRLAARRSELQVHTEAFRRAEEGSDGIKTLAWSRGRLLLGDDLEQLLARASVERDTLVDHKLAFERRRHANGYIYFILNSADVPFDGWLPLAKETRAAAIFDPMTGRKGLAARRTGVAGASEVYLRLAPGESAIVKTFTRSVEGGTRYDYWNAAGAGVPVAGPWSLRFINGGPTLPAAATMNALTSWTELDGAAYDAFSGTAVYRTTFARPAIRGDAWQLDLGAVADSARVRLNGREIATLIAAPFRVTLAAEQLRDENELEVLVTNLAANRIADLDRRDPSWKKFYNINFPARLPANRGTDGLFTAAHWKPRVSGLLGPVTLTPLQRVEVGRR